MKEAEWLACTDPTRMLGFLSGKPGHRKLRLFVCGCCRSAWHLLKDERCQKAVEVGERFADGAADEQERNAAELAVNAAQVAATGVFPHHFGGGDNNAVFQAVQMAVSTFASLPQFLYFVRHAADRVADAVRYDAFRRATTSGGRNLPPNVRASERAAQAALLGDIIGNPFRSVAVDPSWLTWNGGTVAKLAETVYTERAFDRLSILADALEDAGCHDAGILAHCRGSGPHVKGCWVVDLILGRQ
jgi:hypothetical protein